MKLEEVLPYIRKGNRPTYDGIEYDSIGKASAFGSVLVDGVLLSEKWGYIPKRVGFRKAWDHLVVGNRVIKGGKTYHLDPLRNALCVWKHEGGDISAGWYRLSEGIPIEWIDATDFELVED